MVCDQFGELLAADQAAAAIAVGLKASGWPSSAPSLDPTKAAVDLRRLAPQLRGAAFVVVGTDVLGEAEFVGGLLGLVATAARQAGVPCHAIVGKNDLDAFGLRRLDIQHVVEVDVGSKDPTKLLERDAAHLGKMLAQEMAIGQVTVQPST